MTDPTATQVLEAMVAMFDSGETATAAQVVADSYLDHQAGLPEMVGTRVPRKGWLTWGNGRDGAEGSCYYATL